jgi:hypothetical protein
MKWKNFTREDLQKTKAEFHADGTLVQSMAMAQEVVLLTLGPDFWKKHCVGKAGPDSSFLRPNGATEDDRYEFQDKVIRFGDMLYSLKDSEGFDAFLNPLRTNDLESVFFELWVASAFFQSGYRVRFVECTGQKRSDYDLNVHINGTDVAVEAKTRRLGEGSTIPRIKNNLEAARTQLPKDGPGIVAISIPHAWLLSHHDLIAAEIESFLRNTARVNHVIVYARAWTPYAGRRVYISLVEQFDAVRPRHPFKKNPLLLLDGSSAVDGAVGPRKPSFW